MATEDKFPDALSAELEKLLPDAETQAAAQLLLTKYREQLRQIAVSPARMGLRVFRLGTADDELLDALRGLSDTEHPEAGEEQPETA
jgi:hypothetical protein